MREESGSAARYGAGQMGSAVRYEAGLTADEVPLCGMKRSAEHEAPLVNSGMMRMIPRTS